MHHRAFWCLLIIGSTILGACSYTKNEGSLPINISYAEARTAILAGGWKPLINQRADYEDVSSISVFLNLGYHEVDGCSGTGMGYCKFIFNSNDGLFLIVTTQELPFGGLKSGSDNKLPAFVVRYDISDSL